MSRISHDNSNKQLVGIDPVSKAVLRTTPQGQAAIYASDHKDKLRKISAVKTLAKAKKGDKQSKQNILAVHKAAKAGHPAAKVAWKNLQIVAAFKRGMKKIDKAYKSGVGNKKNPVENAYSDGCC